MNKFIKSGLFVFTMIILTACASEDNQEASDTLQPVQAEILIPGKIPLNEQTDLSVKLTQGTEIVDQADEVTFEIWKENNQNNSELIKANYEKNGIYSIDKNFTEGGLYYVQTHVTAQDMHVMPKMPFIVGVASTQDLAKLEEEKQGLGDSSTDHHGSHSHH